MTESLSTQPTPEDELRTTLAGVEVYLTAAEELDKNGGSNPNTTEALVDIADHGLKNEPVYSGGHAIPGSDEWIYDTVTDRYTYTRDDSETGQKVTIDVDPSFGRRLEDYANKHRQAVQERRATESLAADDSAEEPAQASEHDRTTVNDSEQTDSEEVFPVPAPEATTKDNIEDLDELIEEWYVPVVADFQEGTSLIKGLARQADASYRDEEGNSIPAKLVGRLETKLDPANYIFSKDAEKAYKAVARATSEKDLEGSRSKLDVLFQQFKADAKAGGVTDDFDYWKNFTEYFKASKELSDWLKANPEFVSDIQDSLWPSPHKPSQPSRRELRKNRPEKYVPTMRSTKEIRKLTGVDAHDDDFKHQLLVEELTDVLGHYPSQAELNPYLPTQERVTTHLSSAEITASRSDERTRNRRWNRVKAAAGRMAARLTIQKPDAEQEPAVTPTIHTVQPGSLGDLIRQAQMAVENSDDDSDERSVPIVTPVFSRAPQTKKDSLGERITAAQRLYEKAHADDDAS